MFDDLITAELHARFEAAYDEANQLYSTDDYPAAIERMMTIADELMKRAKNERTE